MANTLDPKRTIAELKELRSFSANEDGAQRIAFTPTPQHPHMPSGDVLLASVAER